MVKSSIDGSAVAPFLMKCYEMVEDESTNEIISWAINSNDSFVIWDITLFATRLLPNYFKHSNLSSFIRQLNIYGFRKIDTGRWEYSNQGFLRGQKQLLKNITRRKKNSRARNTRNSPQQIGNENALIQELIMLRHVQESSENKLLVLTETLQGMQKDHQKMMSLLMKSTKFLVQLMHLKESEVEVGKNVVEEDLKGTEEVAFDRMLIDYHQSVDEAPKPLLNSEKPTDADPFDVVKDFYIDVDFMKMLMDENLSPENHSSLTEETKNLT